MAYVSLSALSSLLTSTSHKSQCCGADGGSIEVTFHIYLAIAGTLGERVRARTPLGSCKINWQTPRLQQEHSHAGKGIQQDATSACVGMLSPMATVFNSSYHKCHSRKCYNVSASLIVGIFFPVWCLCCIILYKEIHPIFILGSPVQEVTRHPKYYSCHQNMNGGETFQWGHLFSIGFTLTSCCVFRTGN
ncbi:hypothetical protein AB205_0019420 [Aquarana catesbeiana]|uniref:Uncharacterized protein n=1 Tax=Aquarana catesbeiana TaxID=8400 RepID=A0A2G9SI45_AQUCT|nr:hypothetical protein AB205_0019420 [Aquarana catesbeiana]